MAILYITGSMSPRLNRLYRDIINAKCSVRICVHSCGTEERQVEIYQVASPAGACGDATRLEFGLTREVSNTGPSSGVMLFGLVLFAYISFCF
jgi:hypothetical protein